MLCNTTNANLVLKLCPSPYIREATEIEFVTTQYAYPCITDHQLICCENLNAGDLVVISNVQAKDNLSDIDRLGQVTQHPVNSSFRLGDKRCFRIFLV